MADAFKIVRTRAELLAAARVHDGECKVLASKHGAMVVSPERELGTAVRWDYYFSDEPDSFPFAEYGISR